MSREEMISRMLGIVQKEIESINTFFNTGANSARKDYYSFLLRQERAQLKQLEVIYIKKLSLYDRAKKTKEAETRE